MVRRCSQPRALVSASANFLTLPRTLLVLLLYSALYVVQLRLPPLDRRLITPYEDDPPDPFLITIFIFEQGQMNPTTCPFVQDYGVFLPAHRSTVHSTVELKYQVSPDQRVSTHRTNIITTVIIVTASRSPNMTLLTDITELTK